VEAFRAEAEDQQQQQQPSSRSTRKTVTYFGRLLPAKATAAAPGAAGGGLASSLSPRSRERKSANPSEPVRLIDQARAIFDEYLKPCVASRPSAATTRDPRLTRTRVRTAPPAPLHSDCPKWVCIDLALSQDLEVQLRSKLDVPPTFFADAQRQVFVNMEKDVLPRFLKSLEAAHARDAVGDALNAPGRGSVRFTPGTELRQAYANKATTYQQE